MLKLKRLVCGARTRSCSTQWRLHCSTNSPKAIQDLEVALRRHKPDFISLLQKPAKNATHREEVLKADSVGLPIEGQQVTQILAKSFIEEALIISDLFDLNEYAAVELLLAGENQQPYFPGLSRGLVAVVLYYDGRASLVNALRTLIQARNGRTWSLALSEDLVALATKFTNQLVDAGLTAKILDLISGMDVTVEISRLEKERALGNARHRKQVIEKVREVKQSLADCLFCLACQSPLAKVDILRLIGHLRGDSSVTAAGTMEDVSIALLMAALYCIDSQSLEEEDSEELAQNLPMLSDPMFIPEVHRAIFSPQKWQNPGLKAVVRFAWSLTLRALSQYPNVPDVSDMCELDETIMDMAIEENVFEFLHSAVVATDTFHREEFYLRRVHGLVTDFLVNMPLKVKELRNQGDETARIIMANQHEGLEAPAGLKRDFEHLLRLVNQLYDKDPLKLELALEYWCPPEPLSAPGGRATVYNYRPNQRQVSLHKFVRLAGDLLPPPLYIPYISMLSGLASSQQCAHHCFNLLKMNGMAGGQVSTVSWDHFFVSLNHYYMSLRQEVPPAGDMTHLYRHYTKGITPQEVDGLAAVLTLICRIAEQDETARVALCENQQWLILVVLLGLVSCSVPAQLKADLLLTLAALAKTPEIAANLWHSLEVAQLIPTVPSTSIRQPGGMQIEVDEVEARNEEFPMTRAFLQLMDTLTDSPIPAGLGVGLRAPGFQPYLEFLREHIFLKFNTREYKDKGEKWEVCCGVLGVFYKLLQQHETTPEDFLEQRVEVHGEGSALANKPPGHVLMMHMLNNTPTLQMILYIIDEATRQLDRYVTFPGKEHLEKSALLCIKLVEMTLAKQEGFLIALESKYIMYNNWLPEHALVAVRILHAVCQSTLVQPKIVSILTDDEASTSSLCGGSRLCPDLLHGFVECLECEDPEDVEAEDDLLDEDVTVSQVRSATRQNILYLLLASVDLPAPNMAHFLLGYELHKPVSKTNLQDPGILDSLRTCLHSLLCILGKGLESRHGPSCLYQTPRLAQLTYHMIYKLCANPDASSPTLRYLRTAQDFLYRQLQHIPFQLPDSAERNSVNENVVLSQQSWLLKTVAIELHITSVNRQRSHTQRLLNLLLESSTGLSQKVLLTDGTFDVDYPQYDNDYTLFDSTTIPSLGFSAGGQGRRKLLGVLDSIDFVQNYPPSMELKFFKQSAMEQVIASCEQRDETGIQLCNVKLLYQEIQSICGNVVERNSFRESIFCKRQAFEAWRQLVEIILTACPEDLLHGESRQNMLFEILQDLLLKVSKEDAIPELTAPAAGVILTLMANLRHCFLSIQPTPSQCVSQYSLQQPDGSTVSQSSGFGQSSSGRMIFASSLQVVLKGLIEHLMRSSSGPQRVRANLYGALLYCLHIACKPPVDESVNLADLDDEGIDARLGATGTQSEFERLKQDNIDTIVSYGDNFMGLVCRDACDGHDVGRMLALASLDVIMSIDKRHHWLAYLTSKGYLDHLAEDLLQNDLQLQSMLHEHPAPLRALYMFESKMSLLTRLAGTAPGARALLQSRVMATLAECNVFHLRPETDRSVEGFVPSVLSRYRQQILFPVLRLCLSLLTSMGSENWQARRQILRFVVSHIDVFSAILCERHTSLDLEAMQELALVTAVIGQAGVEGDSQNLLIEEEIAVEFKGHVARLHREMIALLPKYCLSEKLQKQLRNVTVSSGPDGRNTQTNIQLAVEEVTANVIAFCRTNISSCSSQFFRILFRPCLVEAMSRDFQQLDEYKGSHSTARPHNLGVIVCMLVKCAEKFLVLYDSDKQNRRKLQNIINLTSEELKELCGGQMTEKMSSQQRQKIASYHLLQTIRNTMKELQFYSYILENSLYILWHHLDFYLLHCVPVEPGSTLFRAHMKKQHHMRSLQDYSVANFSTSGIEDDVSTGTTGVTRDELEQLKQDAVVCVNESLFKKLQQIEQCYTCKRTRYDFVEALIRRIRRLLKLHTTAAS
ncbi:hypothetical protein NP493_515g00009 [Ridgeia piscesae]|uniref:Nuclear pore complex protein Nup205 n=1 Tax=Ridgeia piscesae TaxID=27915 RepID=A0AAD9NQW5_RIDPI|nr:hypothetical protein NP493_515g00009 [Ridgeia piscesae]